MGNTCSVNTMNSSDVTASDATYKTGNTVVVNEPIRTDFSCVSGRFIKATTANDSVNARVTTLGRVYQKTISTD